MVDEICSVSNCISSGPADWIQKWLHNTLGFFDTEALAWQVVSDERAGFRMYAYEAFPIQFDEGRAMPWSVPVRVTLDLGDYTFLGYDAVSRTGDYNFDCSALSCNSAAVEFPVNECCLIDDVEEAYRACIAVSAGRYEPGPYHLLKVYRRNEGG
jgi:hypothetical protein